MLSFRTLIDTFRSMHTKIISRWILYSRNIECFDTPTIRGTSFIRNSGRCKLGRNVLIRSGYKHNSTGLKSGGFILIVERGAMVSIGDNVGISNSTIYCKQSIIIGNNTLIGTDCKIYDSDFHSTNHENRAARPEIPGKCSPVEIGSDVFIGTGVIILKGVKIGDRSVIGAGSVVSTLVPPDELWCGNPARKIRVLENEAVRSRNLSDYNCKERRSND